jgi:hypothetical protein
MVINKPTTEEIKEKLPVLLNTLVNCVYENHYISFAHNLYNNLKMTGTNAGRILKNSSPKIPRSVNYQYIKSEIILFLKSECDIIIWE